MRRRDYLERKRHLICSLTSRAEFRSIGVERDRGGDFARGTASVVIRWTVVGRKGYTAQRISREMAADGIGVEAVKAEMLRDLSYQVERALMGAWAIQGPKGRLS